MKSGKMPESEVGDKQVSDLETEVESSWGRVRQWNNCCGNCLCRGRNRSVAVTAQWEWICLSVCLCFDCGFIHSVSPCRALRQHGSLARAARSPSSDNCRLLGFYFTTYDEVSFNEKYDIIYVEFE